MFDLIEDLWEKDGVAGVIVKIILCLLGVVIVLPLAAVALFIVWMMFVAIVQNATEDYDFGKWSYEVNDMDDWEKLQEGDGNFFAGNINSLFHKDIKLMCDLDFSGKEYQSLNCDGFPFDGNGHSIKNVNVTVVESGFALLQNYDGELKNLTVENITINALAQGGNISIFGTNCRSFENVTVTGTINAPYAALVGGFTYQSGYTSSEMTFKNCVSDLAINGGGTVGGFVSQARTVKFDSCENKSTINAKDHAGGFVGAAHGEIENDYRYIKRDISFVNCTNSGTVSSKGSAGGLVGYGFKCNAVNCKNEGDVNGVRNVGGLFGTLDGTVKNSTNNGKISAVAGAEDKVANIAGIVGVLKEESEILSCTNNGEIKSDYYVSGGIVANCYGGVAGCVNNGTVFGKAVVGGIVGTVGDKFDPWSFSDATIRVSHCTNNADIKADLFCGGIIGMADLNKVDKATFTAAEYITKYVQKGFDLIEYGYDINNKVLWGVDVNIKRYSDQEVLDFISNILSYVTRATKLEMAYCNSNGKITSTNFAGAYVGVMFSCMVEEEELGTNTFDGMLDCDGIKSEGCTYVNAVDVSKLAN